MVSSLISLDTVLASDWLSGPSLLHSKGTGDTCPPQTTISVWVFAQVLLVVIFSVVERLGLHDFCRNRTKTIIGQYLKGEENVQINNWHRALCVKPFLQQSACWETKVELSWMTQNQDSCCELFSSACE